MFRFGVCLSHAETQRQHAIQFGMSQVEVAAAIQPVHDLLIGCVAAFVPEAHKIQGSGRGEFKAVIFLHPARELLRQFDVAANVELQAFHSVVANYEP